MITMISIFAAGYLAIICESLTKLNKAAVAILMATACWALFFLTDQSSLQHDMDLLKWDVASVAQIVFYLVGAMTIVELIDSHKGFKIITDRIQTKSKRKMLWLVSSFSFFLSAILDNLTTTILMVSLLRKIIPDAKDRLVFCCLVVVAANAGGAWTPIGDVTTTMLWIEGQISSIPVMKALFLPSLVSLLVPLCYFTLTLKGRIGGVKNAADEAQEPGAKLVFWLGIAGLIFVPIFKAWTGLPPFMGVLVSLSFLWLVTDGLHVPYERRKHLQIPHILTKIDISGVLFFLGILLAVGALEAAHLLHDLANLLGKQISSLPMLATFIGVLSAIIDNVPLVAASMGMYPLEQFPVDHPLWMMIAYAAGTGGSLLIIGSSAGVALMGMEKIDFLTYMKKMTLPVLVGYLAGMGVYVVSNETIKDKLASHIRPIEHTTQETGLRGIDAIYCMNLDMRQEKWNAMKEKLDQQGLHVSRVSAINGRTDLTRKMRDKLKAPKTKLLPGQVGCFLTHFSILKDAEARKFSAILVLEDDIDFVAPMKGLEEYIELLSKQDPSWDLLFLDHWHWPSGCTHKPMDRRGSKMSEVILLPKEQAGLFSRVYYRHGTYAMVVSEKGIQKILKSLEKEALSVPIDVALSHIAQIKMYETGQDFVAVNELISDTSQKPKKIAR